MDEIDVSKLKEYLDYDPETGVFVWKKPLGNRRLGHVAGSFNKRAKVFRVGIFGVQFCGNYLALFMTTGRYPTERLRYIDGDPCNNRLSNIEVVHDQLKRGPSGLTKLEVYGAWVTSDNRKSRSSPEIKLKLEPKSEQVPEPTPEPVPEPTPEPETVQYPSWMMMRP